MIVGILRAAATSVVVQTVAPAALRSVRPWAVPWSDERRARHAPPASPPDGVSRAGSRPLIEDFLGWFEDPLTPESPRSTDGGLTQGNSPQASPSRAPARRTAPASPRDLGCWRPLAPRITQDRSAARFGGR